MTKTGGDTKAASDKFASELAAMQVGGPPSSRKALQIDPATASIDFAGHTRKSLFCRAPAGMVADDLKIPQIWARLQIHPAKALKKFDAVFVVGFDESWCADAIASQVDREGVTLTGIRVMSVPSRLKELFSDSNYKVVWGGAGYHVERRADGQKVTETTSSEELAIRDLRALTPRRVAS